MATNYKLRIQATNETGKQFKQLNKNISTTQSAMKKLAGAFAGAFAIRQIVQFGNEALELADTIGKVADSIGVNTEFLQKYQFAAQQAGLTTEEFNKGMQNFTKMVGQAQLRTSEAGRSLQKLGVQVKNTDGSVRSSEEVFVDLFEALDGVGSQFEKNAILADLMGRAGVKLAVMGKDGAEAMKELAESATGVLDEETIRRAERFNDTMNILKRQILAPMQDMFISAANSVLMFMDSLGLIDIPKTIPELQEELDELLVKQEKYNEANSRRRARHGLQNHQDKIDIIKQEIATLEKAEKLREKVALEAAKDFSGAVDSVKSMNAISSTLTSSFKTFFDFTNKEFLNFKNLATQVVKSIIDELIRVHVIKKLLGFGATAFGAESTIGKVFQTAADSMEGGGFTGMGVRAGGVDGRGGFPAILHPNETVIDHTKGQGMGATVNFNISTVDAAGFDQLLTSRKGLITSIINNAMNNQGKMGVV
jgi:hypothetical protein